MHASRIAMALAALGIATATAQQPAPTPPAFAASDLSPAGVKALVATCAGCHGTDGKAIVDTDDLGLAGMPKDRMHTRMKGFRDGTRKATIMHQISKGYSDAEVEAIAEYYSKIKN